MLQAALLLLGCALSRYLWEVDIVIASVVIGMTSLGVIFYIFVLIAGTTSDSCPYQTPYARILRHILHHIRRIRRRLPPVLHLLGYPISLLSDLPVRTPSYNVLADWNSATQRSRLFRALFLGSLPLLMPLFLAFDILTAIFGLLILLCWLCLDTCYLLFHVGHHWHRNSTRTISLDQQTITLDLRCISWILQTSVDKRIQVSALERLIPTSEYTLLSPTVVIDCFNVFASCVNVSEGNMVVVHGSEQLAMASASALFLTLRNLILMDPTSNVLEELHGRYNALVPSEVDFTGLPFDSPMSAIHTFSRGRGTSGGLWWRRPGISGQGHIPFSQRIAEAAQERHKQTEGKKVPRWTLRSAYHLLSLGPISPALTIANCLMVIAMDLGCDVSEVTTSDERCVRILHVFTFLTMDQCASGAVLGPPYPETQEHG